MAFVSCAASLPLRGEEPVASIGRQHAARSGIGWEAHDIDHPQLGPIRYAVQTSAVATTVGKEKIVSLAFVSCRKGDGTVAIELTNAFGSDPAGGLKPTQMPRLVCRSPGPADRRVVVKTDLAARWEIGPLGDPLARGLSPAVLRRCFAIDVLQSVALPSGFSRRSQRIDMEITPFSGPLDTVFAACGEAIATRSAEAPWKPARTSASGRTNVRAGASLDAAMVARLDPGTKLLVQPASTPWWKVKPRSGAGFSGYIREDRLAFE